MHIAAGGEAKMRNHSLLVSSRSLVARDADFTPYQALFKRAYCSRRRSMDTNHTLLLYYSSLVAESAASEVFLELAETCLSSKGWTVHTMVKITSEARGLEIVGR